MSWRFLLCLVLAGLMGVLLGWSIDGVRGALGVSFGWLICFIPLAWSALHHWLANLSSNSKMVPKHALPISAREILARMAWVLTASFVLYWHFGPSLGIGFWLAVLVYYQVALAMQTMTKLRKGHEPPTV